MFFNSKIYQLLNNFDTYQSKVYHVYSWEYIPDTGAILQYLGRRDLIELSKCCKRYRNQLKSRVLESLSLSCWYSNNSDIYELINSYKLEEVLEFMKSDLGSKLKFVKKFTLNCQVDRGFAEIFVKLLPNIKILFLNGYGDCDCGFVFCEINCCLGEGLTVILKDMVHLERVFIRGIDDKIRDYTTENQVFPKSIKLLKIKYVNSPSYNEHELSIYNTIDPSYINLCSLTIFSNRMLQNLSFGMPNLQEVEIEEIEDLDESKVLAFLKANPHLKKLKTDFKICGEEIIKTVLSFKYLEHLRISGGYWEKLEIDILPSNYSIKHLSIWSYSSTINLKIINACSNIDTLYTYGFNISKLKRRINILKLIGNSSGLGIINEIDNLKSFNQIHLKYDYSINEEICKYSLDKLNNYKLIRLISKDFIFKLIN